MNQKNICVIKDYINGNYKSYCKMSRMILTGNEDYFLCSKEFEEKTKILIDTINENKLDEKIELFRSQKIIYKGDYDKINNVLHRNVIYSEDIYIGSILPIGICSFSSEENIVDDMNRGIDCYVHDFDRNLNRNMDTVKFKIVTDNALPIYEYAGDNFEYQKEYLAYGYFQIVDKKDNTYILEAANADSVLLSLKEDKEDIERKILKEKNKLKKLEKKLSKITRRISDDYEYIIRDIDEVYNMDKCLVTKSEIKSCQRFDCVKIINKSIVHISSDVLYDGYEGKTFYDKKVYMYEIEIDDNNIVCYTEF